MSVKQYIGARYVTKIYENSLDPSSAKWEAGVTYEPLTLVTYLNSSYLSKKEVPGSVGDPAANPSYWVLTGAYNGQILYLQNQIDAINTILSTLGKKSYVVIADSYGGYNNSQGRSFVDQMFMNLGITDYHFFWQNSTGFGVASPLNFLDVLQNNEGSITDEDEITDVIVLGSANDQANLSDIVSGITAFVTYVKANYQNATIHIGNLSHSLDSSLIAHLYETTELYKQAASECGIEYIDNSESIMIDLENYDSDNCHPTALGVDKIGNYLTQYIKTGSFEVKEREYLTLISGTNATLSADYMMFIQNNNVVNIMANQGGEMFAFDIASSISIAQGVQALDDIVRIANGSAFSTGNNNISVSGFIYGSGGFIVPAIMYINKLAANKVNTVGVTFFADTALTMAAGTYHFCAGSTSFIQLARN